MTLLTTFLSSLLRATKKQANLVSRVDRDVIECERWRHNTLFVWRQAAPSCDLLVEEVFPPFEPEFAPAKPQNKDLNFGKDKSASRVRHTRARARARKKSEAPTF